MTLTWDDFVSTLGERETSARFSSLISGIGERPVIADAPEEYNDPTGTTRFYKFPASGLEFGIRKEQLDYIHFFVQGDEGYGSYAGPLPRGIDVGAKESSIVQVMGQPGKSGGGKPSPLLGFIHRWIKYDIGDGHSVRFEFSRQGDLRRLSAIKS